MTLRRETLKALETRRNSVMAERRKSQMQTLGANNEYGVTGIVRDYIYDSGFMIGLRHRIEA